MQCVYHRVVKAMRFAKRSSPGSHNNKEFKTRGLDSDQTVSAIKATQKMLNII